MQVAVEHLATHRYALILADCVVPGLPVLDWLAALQGVAPATPLILQSGKCRYSRTWSR